MLMLYQFRQNKAYGLGLWGYIGIVEKKMETTVLFMVRVMCAIVLNSKKAVI